MAVLDLISHRMRRWSARFDRRKSPYLNSFRDPLWLPHCMEPQASAHSIGRAAAFCLLGSPSEAGLLCIFGMVSTLTQHRATLT